MQAGQIKAIGAAFDMEWNASPCIIEDKIITLASDFTGHKKYNPYDGYGVYDGSRRKQPLYLKFASIDKNDHEAMRQFVSDFGFLGLITHMDNPSKQAHEYYSKVFEFIPDIQKEIHIMRSLVEMKKAIDEGIDPVVKSCLNVLMDETQDDTNIFWMQEKTSDKVNYALAALKIQQVINKYLKYTTPKIKYSVNKHLVHKTGDYFSGTWESKSLLSAMYTMFYLDLTLGKFYKVCENRNCGNWFDVSSNEDKKQNFCSPECASRERQRRYREEFKKKKDKKGE